MMGSSSKFLVAVIPAPVFASLMVRPPVLPTQQIYLKQVLWLLRVQLLRLQVVAMVEHTLFLSEVRSVTQ